MGDGATCHYCRSANCRCDEIETKVRSNKDALIELLGGTNTTVAFHTPPVYYTVKADTGEMYRVDETGIYVLRGCQWMTALGDWTEGCGGGFVTIDQAQQMVEIAKRCKERLDAGEEGLGEWAATCRLGLEMVRLYPGWSWSSITGTLDPASDARRMLKAWPKEVTP